MVRISSSNSPKYEVLPISIEFVKQIYSISIEFVKLIFDTRFWLLQGGHKEVTSLGPKLSPEAEAFGEGLSDSVEFHRDVLAGSRL